MSIHYSPVSPGGRVLSGRGANPNLSVSLCLFAIMSSMYSPPGRVYSSARAAQDDVTAVDMNVIVEAVDGYEENRESSPFQELRTSSVAFEC